MPLREFLSNSEYKEEVENIRQMTDKKERDSAKAKLPCATISGTFSTRKAAELKELSGFICVDIDNIDTPEAAKETISQIPYIYYCGLSVSGKGLLAVAKIAVETAEQHRAYFEAIEKDFMLLGYKLDKSCKDVCRLRGISYDANPYFNENCSTFELPTEAPINNDLEPTKADADVFIAQQYADLWEEKGIMLDEYDEWLNMGMALSNLGEEGRSIYHQISRFSAKYDALNTDKKYNEFLLNTRSINVETFFWRCENVYGLHLSKLDKLDKLATHFPYEKFPMRVQTIIEELHKKLNYPKDFISASLFFAVSLAAGKSVLLQQKKGWIEGGNMFLVLIGGRGTNKSSSPSFALEPIQRVDKANFEAYIKEKVAYDAEMAKPLKERDSSISAPFCKQNILSDFTPEILAKTHYFNDRGIAVYNDEFAGFLKNFNRYHSGNDEQLWLQIFSRKPMIVNRMSAEPIRISEPHISVIGTMQNGIIDQYSNGRIENGFFDRLLFVVPDKIEAPKWNDAEIDDNITTDWGYIIDKVMAIPYSGESAIIEYSPDAKKQMLKWQNQLADKSNGSDDVFRGVSAKIMTYCIRFCLIVEVLKYGCRESDLQYVSLDSVLAAQAIADYFLNTALSIHNKINNPLCALSELEKIVFEKLPKSFFSGDGAEIAKQIGMPQRTYTRFLKNEKIFKRVKYGQYEKLELG